MQMWNAGVSVSALSVSWLKVCFIVGECDGGEAAEAVLCNGLPLYKYQNMNLHCHSDADARPCADASSCLLQTVFLCEIHSVWFACCVEGIGANVCGSASTRGNPRLSVL